MLDIEQLKPLGEGTQKIVFEYPDDSNKVIKIIKSEHATPDGGRAGQYKLRAHRSQGIYRQFRRELLQYLQLCKSHYGALKFTFPIETVYGFVATDQGLGLVTERITSPSGRAFSVYDLVKEGLFTDRHAAALDQFFLMSVVICTWYLERSILLALCTPNSDKGSQSLYWSMVLAKSLSYLFDQ